MKHETKDTQAAIVGLRVQVFLVPEENLWTAQAIEIDYAASGDSIEEAKQHFEEGLLHTIQAHLTRFGHLDNLVGAPPEDWRDLLNERRELYRQVSLHRFVSPESFPFDGIDYFVPLSTAA